MTEMTENLIKSIKNAERLASEIIQKAEKNAHARLESVEEQYKINLKALAEKFELGKNDIANKVRDSFLIENAEKKIDVEKKIKLIRTKAEKNREKVTKFIIEKIIE